MAIAERKKQIRKVVNDNVSKEPINRFALLDQVYFMHHNKVCIGKIVGIIYNDNKCADPYIYYSIKGEIASPSLYESSLFFSKEELIATL